MRGVRSRCKEQVLPAAAEPKQHCFASRGNPVTATPIHTRRWLHPLHALLLAFPIALFATGLAADITYLNTAEVQWSNFAAWAIAGALVFGAPVLLWAIVRSVRTRSSARRRALVYLVLTGAMWILGLINSFQHAGDAWSSVGTIGLMLSIICTALALAAGWIGFSDAIGTEGVR